MVEVQARDREAMAARAAKVVARWLGWWRALPHALRYALLARVVGRERALIGASEAISLIPGLLGVYARQAFYRRVLAGVGQEVYFGFLSTFSKAGAQIGARVYIGRGCGVGWVEIGDDVMLADGVQVLSGRHQHGGAEAGAAPGAQPLREQEQVFTKVMIGRGAWIGAGAIVMADVGERAVVGAGAVVVKPVPDGARVGGVPARALGPAVETS